jgi:hypothetical protein
VSLHLHSTYQTQRSTDTSTTQEAATMNPDYEPQRRIAFEQIVKDLHALGLRLMYPDVAQSLNQTWATLKLKRGCRR